MKLILETSVNGFIVRLTNPEWETTAVFEYLDDAIKLFRWFSLSYLPNVTMSDFEIWAKRTKAEGEQERGFSQH